MTDKDIIRNIDLYIRGKLTQKEIDRLWIAFLKNPEHYHWFETELHLRNLARKNKATPIHTLPAPPKGTPARKSYKSWIFAAAAVVLISIGLQFFALDEKELIYGLALDQIDKKELSSADVLRSGDEPASEYDVLINQAVASAYNDETDKAIQEFSALLAKPLTGQQRAKVEINLGILRYNTGDYHGAKAHFNNAVLGENIPPLFEEKAWWFLGNTHLNLRELEAAREAVFNAYSLDGRFRNPALSLLKKLDIELDNVPVDDEP